MSPKKQPAAVLSVSWGYDVTVQLNLTERNFRRILRHEAFTIRGRGYWYEAKFFMDFWGFSGGFDGLLLISYESSKDGSFPGVGFEGTPRQALSCVNTTTPIPNIPAEAGPGIPETEGTSL